MSCNGWCVLGVQETFSDLPRRPPRLDSHQSVVVLVVQVVQLVSSV